MELYPRKCEECGTGMSEGYIFGDTIFCSDACAFPTKKDKQEYENKWDAIHLEEKKGNFGPYDKMDCYWTSWCIDDDGEAYTADGEEIER